MVGAMTAERGLRCAAAVSLLVIASGCNRLFGVQGTELVDARYFDAAIDAPFACPAPGETPQFDRNLVQAVFQNVVDYTTSTATGRAVGSSADGIMEGPIDEPMTLQKGFSSAACLSCPVFLQPRLTPEGDGLYGVLSGMFDSRLVLFRIVGDTWMLTTDLGPTSYGAISSLTWGPTRHLMVGDGIDLRELTITDSGQVTELSPPYKPVDLGVEMVRNPMLTSDGLRMTFIGADKGLHEAMYYADRGDLAARFSTGRQMVDVPVVEGSYMTEDCSRIYLSGLGSVFYAPRI